MDFKMFLNGFQNVFKRISKCFQNLFKIFSKGFCYVLNWSFQMLSKAFNFFVLNHVVWNRIYWSFWSCLIRRTGNLLGRNYNFNCAYDRSILTTHFIQASTFTAIKILTKVSKKLVRKRLQTLPPSYDFTILAAPKSMISTWPPPTFSDSDF